MCRFGVGTREYIHFNKCIDLKSVDHGLSEIKLMIA